MRTKITFILAFVFLAFTVNAQGNKSTKIFYLAESFETGIPETWTIETTGDLSWEHVFDYAIANSTGYPNSHVAGILTSPAVDVTSASGLSLIFDHHFWGMGTATATVEVFNGTDWVEVSYASNSNEQVINVDLNASDNVGNIMSTYSWYFTIDIAPPIASNPGPANSSYVNNQTPTIIADFSKH